MGLELPPEHCFLPPLIGPLKSTVGPLGMLVDSHVLIKVVLGLVRVPVYNARGPGLIPTNIH